MFTPIFKSHKVEFLSSYQISFLVIPEKKKKKKTRFVYDLVLTHL